MRDTTIVIYFNTVIYLREDNTECNNNKYVTDNSRQTTRNIAWILVSRVNILRSSIRVLRKLQAPQTRRKKQLYTYLKYYRISKY